MVSVDEWATAGLYSHLSATFFFDKLTSLQRMSDVFTERLARNELEVWSSYKRPNSREVLLKCTQCHRMHWIDYPQWQSKHDNDQKIEKMLAFLQISGAQEEEV